MTTPTTIVIGAPIAIVQVITTSICTCCTSLVMRVMSDGAPNAPTSRAENSVTWWNRAARRSRPKPIATWAPKYTAAAANSALHERDAEHQRALAADVAWSVGPVQHAVVDDPRVERGQQQRGGGLHGLQHDDEADLRACTDGGASAGA